MFTKIAFMTTAAAILLTTTATAGSFMRGCAARDMQILMRTLQLT